ncbi:LuxR C-terminal-related transcriptional regulator [Thalassobellus citreus]|uniref:LuxR C-terminal-related transcriptional regulator n=1 Tax=Thalassobellus citreus TaxID=3367752 RepID=UPI00379A20B1
MRKPDVKKVFEVWETKNKISKPDLKEPDLHLVDQISSLFSLGDFYYYIINFVTYKMEFVSEGVKKVLGINPEEFSLEKYFSLLHPEDVADLHRKEQAAIIFKLEKIPIKDITKYKTVYLIRMLLADNTEKTLLHQAKAISVSKDGKVQQVIGIHTDVTHFNIINDNKVSFIGYKCPNYYYDEKNDTYNILENLNSIFTKREKEILNEIAKGKNSSEIAKNLNVSSHTINTHKRNILQKTNCKNTSELIAKCIREGII